MVADHAADDRRVALVTGASSGIGLELARLLAADGMRLALVARDAAKLDSVAQELGTAGWSVLTIAQDLAAPDGVDRVMAQLDGLDVDVLVNNAGYAVYGAFSETAPEAELAMLQVNVMALTALTKGLLPGMVARGRGRILNLGSTAAFLPGPLMTAYYASKAYVLSFSEGLAEELRGTGFTVTVLCPGRTRTGFQQRAAMEESRLIKATGLQSAADVAKAGYEGMMAGKTVVVPSWSDRITSIAPRFVPRALVPRLVKRVQEPER